MSIPRSSQEILPVGSANQEIRGLLRKQPIEAVFKKLVVGTPYGSQLPNFGDDAAVIPWGDGFCFWRRTGSCPSS